MEQELETGKKDALTRRQLLRACVAAPLAFALAAASPSEADAASKPGKAKVTSWSPRSRAVKVSWRRVARAKRYQVKIYTNSSLKKCVATKTTAGTSLVIEGLKKASFYYVRVRGYRISGGRRIYGKWSKKKLVHTKVRFDSEDGWELVDEMCAYVKKYRKCRRKSVVETILAGDSFPASSNGREISGYVRGGMSMNIVGVKNYEVVYSYDLSSTGKIYDYDTGKWVVKK